MGQGDGLWRNTALFASGAATAVALLLLYNSLGVSGIDRRPKTRKLARSNAVRARQRRNCASNSASDRPIGNGTVVDQSESAGDEGVLPGFDLARRLYEANTGNADVAPRGDHDFEPPGTSREQQEIEGNVLDVLYKIGEDQARRSGYLHRGVNCDGCNMHPIRGIRYHCANCWDFDLCEACESQQIHNKTHIMYKIRIPAPTRGSIKEVKPSIYPGAPHRTNEMMSDQTRNKLLAKTEYSRQDLDALYDQYRCIANQAVADDSSEIPMAINRMAFDRYFAPYRASGISSPNLIHDRLWSFYDTNRDGLITFEEFVVGLDQLNHNLTRQGRLQRLFKAFDLNEDGYVCRRDFLYIMRANYAMSREHIEDIFEGRNDWLAEEDIEEVVQSSRPISAQFGMGTLPQHRSRHGEGKIKDNYGDLILEDGSVDPLRNDTSIRGARADAIIRQATGGSQLLRSQKPDEAPIVQDEPVVATTDSMMMDAMVSAFNAGEDLMDADNETLLRQFPEWPPEDLLATDVEAALGAIVPSDEIMDPMDRKRVLLVMARRQYDELEAEHEEKGKEALHERWRRRQFYLDEESGLRRPEGFHDMSLDPNSDAAEAGKGKSSSIKTSLSRRPSLRSRSSSKVRFDDSAISADDESDAKSFTSKSDISSRSTPHNERWGGLELKHAPADVGQDVIYEAVEQAFNDLLDHFFKDVEDQAMEVMASAAARKKAQKDMHLASNRNIDPTMPQNKPDSEDVEDAGFSPTSVDFELWTKHERIEKEAKQRGGFGLLDYQEFMRKMRGDLELDQREDRAGGQQEFWAAKADLGRFSFLSNWLEMGSF